ncbi:MAG: hypothetical protein ACOC2R_04635 [Spirochaetota bacterium]
MDKRKSDIHEHQSAIDELEVSIERQTAELGRLILQNDKCETEGIKEPFLVGKEIQAEIAAKESRREDIRSALERMRQLEEQLRELEEEDKTFEKSRGELIGLLGAHGYRVYRTGSLEAEKFNKIFEEINELDAQLSEKERAVQSLSVAQDEKNIFKKLPGTAKIAMLKSGIVRLEKKRDAALARAGEQLLETAAVEEIPDEQVRSVTSNIKQQEDRREERIQQREALSQEKERLNQRIESQSAAASPEKALKQLESEISRQQERLYQQHQQIGKAFLLQPSLENGGDDDQQAVLNRIQELESQKQQHQDKVNKLQSELEIEELQDAMKKKEEQISRLEKKISEEKQEVEQIRDELSADNNRITELRRMVQSDESGQAEKKPAKKSSSSKKKSSDAAAEAAEAEKQE